MTAEEREIGRNAREAAEDLKLSCPCCGASLGIVVRGIATQDDRRTIVRAILESVLELETVEDAEATYREDLRAGRKLVEPTR